MTPPRKKQKTDESIPAPIIFKSPGWKPDVCLKVFGKEFHVVSVVLKLHSEFFRKFFEPSGGILPSSSNPAFTSEWFTALDGFKDGVYEDWALSSDRKFKGADYSLYKGDIKHQETAFKNLLCALFGTTYKIHSVEGLGTFVGLARYYSALPAASRSIFASCKLSTSFFSAMMDDPLSVMEYARVLRNESLFRESLILSLGPWSLPKYRSLSDPVLRDVAISAHLAISGVILDVHQQILAWSAESDDESDVERADVPGKKKYKSLSAALSVAAEHACWGNARKGKHYVYLPSYYRECVEALGMDKCTTELVQKIVAPLVKNELRMQPNAISGKSEFRDHFFFLVLKKDDLPWDSEEDLWYS